MRRASSDSACPPKTGQTPDCGYKKAQAVETAWAKGLPRLPYLV